MISKKSALVSAALSGLMLTVGCAGMDSSIGGTQIAMGQCHGVNSCKGKGACEGVSHSCEGKNACEGKGWLKMSQSTCESIQNGTWMAMPEKEKPDYYSR